MLTRSPLCESRRDSSLQLRSATNAEHAGAARATDPAPCVAAVLAGNQKHTIAVIVTAASAYATPADETCGMNKMCIVTAASTA